MSPKALALVCLLAVQFLVTGCARYEFDLTKPADLATHVGPGDATVARAPLAYRLNAVDGRLVMRIYNNGDATIQLIGQASTIVDPAGQSHPLPSQSIAPQSFIKLIFPPLRPHLEQDGPSIGIGLGVVAGRERYGGLDHPFGDGQSYGGALDPREPRYFYVDSENDFYWNWDGETDMRASLVFGRGDERFEQDFVFHRAKM